MPFLRLTIGLGAALALCGCPPHALDGGPPDDIISSIDQMANLWPDAPLLDPVLRDEDTVVQVEVGSTNTDGQPLQIVLIVRDDSEFEPIRKGSETDPLPPDHVIICLSYPEAPNGPACRNLPTAFTVDGVEVRADPELLSVFGLDHQSAWIQR